jgi:ferrochelatase
MKKAILLLNMGGPNNLDEVKTFLANMFNDKNIIQAPTIIRKLISFMIVKSRLNEAKENYKKLGGKSPIINYTKNLVNKLQKKTGIDTFYVMRYTHPFSKDILKNLIDYDEIYAIPLYPHYSQTTTKSSFEDLLKEAKKLNIETKIKTIDFYYTNKKYNQVIVKKIEESLNGDNPKEFDLIFSAHGLPKKIIDKGDLYQKQIKLNRYFTIKELLKKGIIFNKTHLAYQSRLGPIEWIRPYLEDKLKEIKNRKIIIYPIAFTIDNSETEFELEIEYKEMAKKLGFTDIRIAKCPNDDDIFVECLSEIIDNISK